MPRDRKVSETCYLTLRRCTIVHKAVRHSSLCDPLTSGKSCHSSGQDPHWFPFSPVIISRLLTMTYKTLTAWPSPTFLASSSTTSVQPGFYLKPLNYFSAKSDTSPFVLSCSQPSKWPRNNPTAETHLWEGTFAGIYNFFFNFVFNIYLFLRQRETEHERGRGRERGRHRIGSRLQALSRQPRAWRGARTHGPQDCDLSWSRTLNWLSHPGAPLLLLFTGSRKDSIVY